MFQENKNLSFSDKIYETKKTQANEQEKKKRFEQDQC